MRPTSCSVGSPSCSRRPKTAACRQANPRYDVCVICPLALSLVVLTTAVEQGPERPRLIVLDLQTSKDLEPAVSKALTEALTASAARTGLFVVTSQAEMTALLGLERQRQLLGCAESSASCTAELAGALGAQFLVSGSITRLGAEVLQLSLQVQDTGRAVTIGRSTRIAPNLVTLREQVPFAFAEASATPPPPEPSRALPTAMLIAGGTSVVTGALLMLQASLIETTVATELRIGRSNPETAIKPFSDYQAQLATVSAFRIGGIVATALGVGGLVSGIILWPSSSGVAIAPLPNGLLVAGYF